jgi:hypothetical protein
VPTEPPGELPVDPGTPSDVPPAEPVVELWVPDGEPVELDGKVAEPVPVGDPGPVVVVPDGPDCPEPPPPEGLDWPPDDPPLGDELPPELDGDDEPEGLDGLPGMPVEMPDSVVLQAASDATPAASQKCLKCVIRCTCSTPAGPLLIRQTHRTPC